MKHLISLLICLTLVLSGCSKEKNYVFFSSNPIYESTFDFNQVEKVFKIGQKIHYVIVKNTPFQSKKLRVQIIKTSDKVEVLGYEMAYGNDYEVNPNKQFFINSICLHSKGMYVFRVFDPIDYNKPYVESYFWIEAQ